MKHSVSLITYTPNPEKCVAIAAKLCYSKSSGEDLIEKLSEKKVEEFIEMLSDLGHESPIEHVSFTFLIENVSRSLLAQITRHRIASFSVKSQRYVKEGQFEYILPPEIENSEEAKEIFIKSMSNAQQSYNRIADILALKHEKELINEGKDPTEAKKQAQKLAIEDARFVLPNACSTQMLVTMNARSLHNFFKLRCCNRAQWEIRAVANDMLKLVKEVAPVLFKNAGPSCAYSSCSEGAMTCGKSKQMREYYKSL